MSSFSYYCNYCDYNAGKSLFLYKQHLSTKKHHINTNIEFQNIVDIKNNDFLSDLQEIIDENILLKQKVKELQEYIDKNII